MNLFSADLIASAKQAMEDVFDSFKRDEKIKIYVQSRIFRLFRNG